MVSESNKIKIGGVTFNQSDIKSSETIKKDGKILNSVFLKDGTHVVFPNQAEKNGSEVIQENYVESKPEIDIGYSWQNDFEFDFYLKEGFRENPNKKVTTFNRLSNAEITGTEAEDTYNLNGCRDSKVDVSQNDKNYDEVTIQDSVVSKDNKNTKFKSANNTVELGKYDEAYTPREKRGLFGEQFKRNVGPKTVKE